MKKKRRLLSFLLCGTMLFSLCTQPVSAGTGGQSRDGGMAKRAEGLCEHHTRHDADCGYAEEAQGTDCTHQHTKDCYTEVTRCVYEHEANGGVSDKDSTPSNATKQEPEEEAHICSEESGCNTGQAAAVAAMPLHRREVPAAMSVKYAVRRIRFRQAQKKQRLQKAYRL